MMTEVGRFRDNKLSAQVLPFSDRCSDIEANDWNFAGLISTTNFVYNKWRTASRQIRLAGFNLHPSGCLCFT
jgi:hypothetical protein